MTDQQTTQPDSLAERINSLITAAARRVVVPERPTKDMMAAALVVLQVVEDALEDLAKSHGGHPSFLDLAVLSGIAQAAREKIAEMERPSNV